jgi:uncharacterized protein (TIGR00299 family) protein
MTRILFVDPIGGAAGDMLLAALLDAGASEQAVRDAVDAVLPGRFAISTEEVSRAGLRGRMLRAERLPGAEPSASRDGRALLAAVDDLPQELADRARSVLERLLEAEARVHGTDPANVHLEALGDDDTLLDIVGIAAALDSFGIDDIRVGPVPLGTGGSVSGGPGHADLLLPAPAVVELLHGFPVRGGGGGETVTPTAAAVFAALAEPSEAIPSMTLEAAGYGAGTRDDADRPNLVRVLVGTATKHADPSVRELIVVEANLDDLTPELVADATGALFAAGAVDVWTAPVQMKKGRSGVVVSAICDAAAEPAVRRAFFEATSSFGVRAHGVVRTELKRRMVATSVSGGTVRIKVGELDGRVVTATPEHDDVAELARQIGRPVREVYEEAAAAATRLRNNEIRTT